MSRTRERGAAMSAPIRIPWPVVQALLPGLMAWLTHRLTSMEPEELAQEALEKLRGLLPDALEAPAGHALVALGEGLLERAGDTAKRAKADRQAAERARKRSAAPAVQAEAQVVQTGGRARLGNITAEPVA